MGLLVSCILAPGTLAAAPITATTQTIDFTGVTGAGFANPPGAGQLDSNDWAVTGVNDAPGSTVFGGGPYASGDFARGTAAGAVATGGVYAFNRGGGNIALGVQPTADDFTPGRFILRLTNTTGQDMTGFELGYELLVRNDQGRGNSFNVNYLINGDPFAAGPPGTSLSTSTSVDASDLLGLTTLLNFGPTIITDALLNGQYLDLIFFGDDVSGSGSRDEFGIDNISFRGIPEETGGGGGGGDDADGVVPEPSTLLLISLGLMGLLALRLRGSRQTR